jgi:hypothetical protein
MHGELIRYTWAPNPGMAWGLVHLSQGRDGDMIGAFVYEDRDAALKGDKRAGSTLYRVVRQIRPADQSTGTPDAGAYAFVCSSATEYTIWTKPTVNDVGGSEYDGVWSFRDAPAAVERTGWANKENARYEGPDNPRFATFLLTWDVTEEEK